MQEIKNINGLTVDVFDGERSVYYQGIECPILGERTVLCERDTSYKGCVLDSWETYATPIGVVERHYWARGAGLERSGTDWRIIPVDEILQTQTRFEAASRELQEARKALEHVAQ